MIRIRSLSRQWIIQAQLRNATYKSIKSMELHNERIESDPRVIRDIEVVDFDSSFSDSQGSSQPISYKMATGIYKEARYINNNSQAFFSHISDSSDFDFSDDDEMILKAAADHKLLKREVSPETASELKRPASSPLKKEPFKPILKETNFSKPNMFKETSKPNILGFHTVSFERTEEPTNIQKSPKFQPSPIIPSTASFKSPSRNTPLQAMRNFTTSTTKSISASSTAKKDSYHSIQFATQKQEFVPSADNIKNVKPIILLSEQEYVLKQVLSGNSLFYTGSAGTGKSVLLKTIIKALKNHYKEGGVAVTASTGLAACNIGGITLHSFAGVGLAKEPVDQLLKKLRRNRKAVTKWLKTKVLIIDEISMVDGELLNKFNEMAKRIRKNQLPFGGIQLVVCGDFYQLPPVVKKTDTEGNELSQMEQFFAFECSAWKENIKQTIILREIFRQKGDQVFVDMLNEMRNGVVSEESIREFNRLSRPLKCPAGIVPTELFATRNEVDRANNFRLNKIKGEAQVYSSADGGIIPNPQRQTLLSNFLAPSQLFLKKDAQVMCIKNFDDTLVNGSLGQVIDFMDRDTYLKAFESTEESDYIFADTSLGELKSQNLTCTSEMGEDKKSEKSDKKSLMEASQRRKDEMAQNMQEDSKNKKYPLVRFLLPDGVNTRTVLVEPEQWTVEDDTQQVLVSRVQLPLILSWAISIHKSQGQTLPKVKVDLKNVFETGQSYVALSRAVSREGLQVLNFNETKVRSHPKVVNFYKTLMTAEDSRKVSKGQQKLEFERIQYDH